MEIEKEILDSSKIVAVVGISPKDDRPSHIVGAYLQAHGYRVIPVNPAVTEILGERSYSDLSSISQPVDVVDIFRRPEDVVPVVKDAIKIEAKVIWMQEGVINHEAYQMAEEAGLKVVMDKCMRKMHMKLHGIGEE